MARGKRRRAKFVQHGGGLQSAGTGGRPEMCVRDTFLRAAAGPEVLAGEAEFLGTPSPWIQGCGNLWKDGGP